MELPTEIKTLYKHWDYYTKKPKVNNSVSIDPDVYKEIVKFVNERILIYEKKVNDRAKPYTTDPILANYRFCNIYRELDRQTIYYHKLLRPYEDNYELWLLNMLFCRSVARTETIDLIGLLSFDKQNNKKVFKNLVSMQTPKYGNAYIFPISIIQKSPWNNRERFFCEYYPQLINQVAEIIKNSHSSPVFDLVEKIVKVFGFNLRFIWTEVLIDIAYQYPDKINLYEKFPIGPGSIPTMKSLNKKADPLLTNLQLAQSNHPNIKLLEYNGLPLYLSAENWEGIGCEFRKYTNLLNGKGRKRIYR